MNIGGVVFPLEQQSRDDESVVYHGQYDTEGVPHTKSGDRQPVQVSIEVRCLRAVELACSQPVLCGAARLAGIKLLFLIA